MSKLSGVVAVLDHRGAVKAFRDLGPTPVEVKPGRAIPVDDIRPALKAGEVHGTPIVTVRGGRAVRTFPAVRRAPAPPSLEERVAALEAAVGIGARK